MITIRGRQVAKHVGEWVREFAHPNFVSARQTVLRVGGRAALTSEHVAEIATIDAPSDPDRIVGFS
jgi:hypothetical protein